MGMGGLMLTLVSVALVSVELLSSVWRWCVGWVCGCLGGIFT